MSPAEFYTSPSCRIAAQGQLMIICIEGALEMADLDALAKLQDQMATRPHKINSITVMNRGFMSVKPGITQRGIEIAGLYKEKKGLIVQVVNGRGLMAVMARTAMAAFSMLDRTGTTMKFSASVPEGLAALKVSLAEQGTPLSEAELDGVQKFIDAHPASRGAAT